MPDDAPPLAARLPDPEPQHDVGKKVLRPDANEGRGPQRFKVRITRRGTKLLDVDNGAGGCKALLDAIRYEGLVSDDRPEIIDFEFRQEKVKREHIGTEILIEPIP